MCEVGITKNVSGGKYRSGETEVRERGQPHLKYEVAEGKGDVEEDKTSAKPESCGEYETAYLTGAYT